MKEPPHPFKDRPRIFVSAVTKELQAARDLVVSTLEFLGLETESMSDFGPETGHCAEMLEDKIDSCQALIQLVGFRYGAEPPVVGTHGHRHSYTQHEATYANTRDLPIWYPAGQSAGVSNLGRAGVAGSASDLQGVCGAEERRRSGQQFGDGDATVGGRWKESAFGSARIAAVSFFRGMLSGVPVGTYAWSILPP